MAKVEIGGKQVVVGWWVLKGMRELRRVVGGEGRLGVGVGSGVVERAGSVFVERGCYYVGPGYKWSCEFYYN